MAASLWGPRQTDRCGLQRVSFGPKTNASRALPSRAIGGGRSRQGIVTMTAGACTIPTGRRRRLYPLRVSRPFCTDRRTPFALHGAGRFRVREESLEWRESLVSTPSQGAVHALHKPPVMLDQV